MDRFQKQIVSALILAHLIGTTGQARVLRIRQSPGSSSEVSRALSAQRTKRIQFKIRTMGDGWDKDGVHLAVASYEASDGVVLALTHYQCVSAVAAQEYFMRAIGKVTRITKRSKKKDKAGRVVGERAEGVFPASSPNEETTSAVLWTFGSDLYEIRSSSLRDNRELEKLLSN